MTKKNILLLGLTTLIFIGCEHGYAPGDILKIDGTKGVVVEVSPDKKPLLLMSLDEIENVDADSAYRWASSFSDTSWHLPSKREMERVKKFKTLININLEKKGEKPILKYHTFYWTQTPCSESHTYACGPEGIGCYFSTNYSPYYRARAVKTLYENED